VTLLYPQKLALTSPTGGGRSVGIVRSRTKATEFSLVWSGVELRVMCPVCRVLQHPANWTHVAASNKICSKKPLLHLVGILFPHIKYFVCYIVSLILIYLVGPILASYSF